jgi:hypothetical protein
LRHIDVLQHPQDRLWGHGASSNPLGKP